MDDPAVGGACQRVAAACVQCGQWRGCEGAARARAWCEDLGRERASAPTGRRSLWCFSMAAQAARAPQAAAAARLRGVCGGRRGGRGSARVRNPKAVSARQRAQAAGSDSARAASSSAVVRTARVRVAAGPQRSQRSSACTLAASCSRQAAEARRHRGSAVAGPAVSCSASGLCVARERAGERESEVLCAHRIATPHSLRAGPRSAAPAALHRRRPRWRRSLRRCSTSRLSTKSPQARLALAFAPLRSCSAHRCVTQPR
jgi:hypothetical protein